MTARMERKAEPAVEADIPHLVEIYFGAFSGSRLRAIFPNTDGGRRWVHDGFKKHLGPRYEGGPETKVLVSRDPEGKQLRQLPLFGP